MILNDSPHFNLVLKPVKGYNIIEKIRLANEQLYEIEIPFSKSKQSKVSFRDNLVEFEPDLSSDDGYVLKFFFVYEFIKHIVCTQ